MDPSASRAAIGLVSEGTDAGLLQALKAALGKGRSDVRDHCADDHQSQGERRQLDPRRSNERWRPSVLYDAVALLLTQAAIDDLLQESSARDFVADAFAHCKFIGYVGSALPLFAKAGIAADDLDEGFVTLESAGDAKSFVDRLGKLHVWEREPNVEIP